MLSEFAKRLAEQLPEASFIGGTALRDYVPRQRMIDAELQEVREVLALLSPLREEGKPCWCESAFRKIGDHEIRCQRARALYSKLEVK
jgi:hypothetical protein